ncbi:NDR1/HIN1-like protein [Drosera capensis]
MSRQDYQKQPLNGAYYGPSIPPPPNTYNRPGRRGLRGGCCLFDCLCDCGCCLLSCVFKIIFTIVILIGIAALVFWLVVRPHAIKFQTTEASVSQFNLSGSASDTLLYDLTLNFTVRNPNSHIGVYYDVIDLRAYYDDQRFAATELTPFYQGKKNTTDLGLVALQGQTVITASSGLSSDYSTQKTDGVFDITVKMYLTVRFKIGWVKIGKFKPKIQCDLKVPLSSSGQSFQSTGCKYDL